MADLSDMVRETPGSPTGEVGAVDGRTIGTTDEKYCNYLVTLVAPLGGTFHRIPWPASDRKAPSAAMMWFCRMRTSPVTGTIFRCFPLRISENIHAPILRTHVSAKFDHHVMDTDP